MKSRLFTLHQLITIYRHDINKKSEEVNSVNSYMEKKNFTDVQYYLRLGSVYRNLTDGGNNNFLFNTNQL
ncbi:hypothetical protein E8Q25_11455 [Salmonella enterica]|nr:hypothetical protein [Salmonella enterica subsp. enterica serovar Bonariensis]